MGELSNRIARMIENDGSGDIKRTMSVVQSDIMSLLCEFMDVRKLDVTVDRAQGVGFELKISAEVERFYGVGNTTENE